MPQTHHMIGPPGWRANLNLLIGRRDGRSTITRCSHLGPLRVQRPFYPEGPDPCHIYVLHPPGGLVGGDELLIELEVDAGAAALVTTPAAGKFYRSDGAIARQTTHLRVAAEAALEWLPQETILFNGARADMRTCVELAAGARFLSWEILCLGRPGAGELFHQGGVRQGFELWREGKPLYIERARYEEGGAVLSTAWGLAGHAVSGSLVCVLQAGELIAELREAVCPKAGLFSATQLDEVLICRYLGDHAEDARACFETAWSLLRPHYLQRTACAPRIWAT